MHNDLKRRTQLPHRLPLVLVFVLAAHALVLTYFFLHEAGHALVVYSFGGKLTAFKVGLWESHYSYQGQFSAFQNSLRTSAGVLFPILVWLIALFWMHRRVAPVWSTLRWIASWIVLGSLLPWVVKPVLYMVGYQSQAPFGDDVAGFLSSSHWNGFLVSGISLLLLIALLLVFQSRAGFQESLHDLQRVSRAGIHIHLAESNHSAG